jgi:hypothetical protein
VRSSTRSEAKHKQETANVGGLPNPRSQLGREEGGRNHGLKEGAVLVHLEVSEFAEHICLEGCDIDRVVHGNKGLRLQY